MCIRILLAFCVILVFEAPGMAQWVQTSGPSGGTITALATERNTVFAATPSGVFRTTDRGAMWQPTTQTSQVVAMAALDTDIFIATANDIARSTDNGATWKAADAGLNGFPSLLDAAGPELFVQMEEGSVFRSSDRGKTWDQVTTLFGQDVTSFTEVNGLFFAGSGSSGIFSSTDFGVTWSLIPGTGLPSFPYNSISSMGTIGTDLFASTDTAIFISTDFGTSWNPLSMPVSGFSNGMYIVGSELISSGYNGLFISTNEGSSWSESNAIANTYFSSLVGFGNDLFAGTQMAGIYRSTDAGSDWNLDNAGIIISDISSFAVLGNNLYASTVDGNLYETTDNGSDWTNIGTGPSFVNVLGASNGNLFGTYNYVYSTNSSLYGSSDSGATWTDLLTLNNFSIINFFAIANEVFAATTAGVFVSSDGGATWIAASSGINSSDFTVLSITGGPSGLFCGSTSGAIYKSSNNGETWNTITPLNSIDSITTMAAIGPHILAGGPNQCFMSSDNGLDWNNAPIDATSITCLLAVGPNIFAATNNGIFVSSNGGTDWVNESAGLSKVPVNVLTVNNGNLYAGTETNGVWERPLVQMIPFSDVMSEHTQIEEPNYPNPFSHATTIPFTLAESGRVIVRIFDMLGHEVALLTDADYSAGSHRIIWEATNEPSGVYRCQISSPNSNRTLLLSLEKSQY